jgi:hypothetical protein
MKMESLSEEVFKKVSICVRNLGFFEGRRISRIQLEIATWEAWR